MDKELAVDNVFLEKDGHANDSKKGLIINDKAKESLLSTTKWIKFLAITESISIGFTFLSGTISAITSNFYGIIGGIFYIVISAIMLYPTLKMFRHCSKTRAALLSNDEHELHAGMQELRRLFKFYGILCIIYIAVAFIGFVVIASVGINNFLSAIE